MATKTSKSVKKRTTTTPLRLFGKGKKPRKSQAIADIVSTTAAYELEVTANESLKKQLHAILTTPCACCGQPRTFAIAALQMGIDKSLLWKWANRKGALTTEHNFTKIETWVKQAKGRQVDAEQRGR